MRTARDEAVAQATQANALRQALDLATVRYEAGLSSYLDLLDAQRSLFGAELAMSQAQLGELTAAVQLYKALGGSWIQAFSDAAALGRRAASPGLVSPVRFTRVPPTPSTQDFEGRVAIVTGAARGLGRAAAARLYERGASVAINVRDRGPRPDSGRVVRRSRARRARRSGRVGSAGRHRAPDARALRPSGHHRQQRRAGALDALPRSLGRRVAARARGEHDRAVPADQSGVARR